MAVTVVHRLWEYPRYVVTHVVILANSESGFGM